MYVSDQEDYHYRFKVAILGDTKSGKTTFLDSTNSHYKFKQSRKAILKFSNLKVLKKYVKK